AQTHLRHQKDRRAIRTALGAIRVAFAEDADAVRSLRAIAPAQARVELLGPIVALPDPPACSSAERDDMAQSLRARPVWLAAFPDPDELAAVLAAHRTLLRSSHRLLLLIAIEDERGGSAMAGQLRAEGWRVARRGVEGEPDDTTEIFVADAADEIGLWYRLAPVTFLGGSLSGARLADPSGPASLGSALVAGPNRGDAPRAEAADLLKRLSSVGGLRSVAEGDELPSTIAELLVPDRAAALAHAAWDVVSDGARVQDRLVAEVADALRHVVE
ncbi:MAG: 3-deoxy-D-manno-octulosonic acid transferase, partial [Pseudomonadota bacterium]